MKPLILKKPLSFGATEITELKFREHTTAADYLAFDQRGGVAQRIALIASLTGSDESLIMRLHGVDYRRAEKLADAIMALDDEADTPLASDVESKPALTVEQENASKK